jgi:mannose-1-phosphate guanylyltransferase
VTDLIKHEPLDFEAYADHVTGTGDRLDATAAQHRSAVDEALDEFGKSQLTRAAGVVLEPVMRALSQAIATGASRTRRHANLSRVATRATVRTDQDGAAATPGS